jgi:hypothetical protein
MREIRHVVVNIDHYLEEAARAKQQLDAERWRDEMRPRAMRLFAARTTNLAWSRALLKLVVGELFPDDLFKGLVGNLDRVPRRRWPQVVAIALALRHSWRRDGLKRIAKRLRVPRRPRKRRTSSPQSKQRRKRARPEKASHVKKRSSVHIHWRAHDQRPRLRAGTLAGGE